MKLLKKVIVGLVLASLILGVLASYASAQGPVGAPPTQNVSPTFSDVTVQGKVVTNRVGYPDLAKTKFGNYIKALKGDAMVTKMIQVLSAYKPVVIEDALVVSGQLYGLTAHFFGNLQVEGMLDVVGDTNLNTVFADKLNISEIYSYVDQSTPNDTTPVIIADKDGLRVEKDATILGNLNVQNITTSGDFTLKPKGNISFGDLGNLVDSVISVVNHFTVVAVNDVTLLSPNVAVVGHLKADSIGMFHEILAPSIDFNGEAMKTAYAYCAQYEAVTGCNFTTGSNLQLSGISTVSKTFDPIKNKPIDPPLKGCSATFRNPGLKSGISANLRAICFNPNY